MPLTVASVSPMSTAGAEEEALDEALPELSLLQADAPRLRPIVEEQDMQRVLGCARADEGVRADDFAELVGGPQQDRYLEAEPLRDQLADPSRDQPGQRRVHIKQDVAALDVGSHIRASRLVEYPRQVLHGQPVLAADVDPPK
jgi:hypothetical protein